MEEKEKIFVLMPFQEDLKDVYDIAIKRAIEESGFECLRADEIFGASIIIEDIENSIRDCLFVIAGLTTRNPNVFYEVGYARALDKEAILITQNSDDVPFDLRHRRYIHYEATPRGVDDLRKNLTKTIRSVVPRARRTENARLVQESAGSELVSLREEVQSLKTAMYQAVGGEIGDNPFPIMQTARMNAQKAACQSNLKQLGLALMQLAQDENERFPSCDKWCDDVMPYIHNPSLFKCAAAPDLTHAYAMNKALDGFYIAYLEDSSRTPLLFDSSIGHSNASADTEGVCDPPRHLGRNNILFADGHVASVKPEEMGDLIWKPKKSK